MENKTCCICHKEFTGWGNNPFGALNSNKQLNNWNSEDCCCDKCNSNYVIPGRLYNLYGTIPPDCLVKTKPIIQED